MHARKIPLIAHIDLPRLALTGLLLSIFNTVNATEIRVALVTDRAPYCFKKNNVDSGIEVDLIRAALKPFGHVIKPVIVPKARLSIVLKSEEADVSATIQGTDGDGLFFSEPYISFQNQVISKKKKNIAIGTLADIDKYSFIIWQGGWRNLGPLFEATYKPDPSGKFRPNYNEAHSQLNQSKMFWAERTDLIIVDKKIFEHFRKQLHNEFKTEEEVVFHDILKSQTNYQTAFRSKELRDQFNEGLRKIRSDGTYQTILDAYK